MTPVKQEFVHDPSNGIYGDCQRAVIASLLDLPIKDVPHFLGASNNDSVGYWEILQKFLRSKGYAWLVVPAKSGAAFYGADDESIYHEISGPSPRGKGVTHAVVGCDGRIVFDPHPSNAGLAGDPSDWGYAYLVKTCEADPQPAQDGFALLPKSVIEMTLNCLNTPERADLRLVLSDLHKALWAAQAQEQERKPLGQDWIEERAHRRCRRYIMIDTEAPYQFNAHTLMDLVRDIEAKIKEQP